MAIFSDKEFDRMLVNPNGKNFEKDSVLQSIFGKINSQDIPMVKYVLLMYDSQSPLRKKIADLVERKKEAASMAELKEYQGLFDLSDERLVGLVNKFLRFQNNRLWAILATQEELLWQYQSELLKPINVYKGDKEKLQGLEVKGKLMNDIDTMLRRCETYETTIFGDNTQGKDKIVSYNPELMAKKLG